MYEMNRNTRISVQTPVGVNDYFQNSEVEVSYGDVDLQTLLYQNDVARLSQDLSSTQLGNDKMESMAEYKLLDFNLKKSCFILFGNKSQRQVMEEGIPITTPWCQHGQCILGIS